MLSKVYILTIVAMPSNPLKPKADTDLCLDVDDVMHVSLDIEPQVAISLAIDSTCDIKGDNP